MGALVNTVILDGETFAAGTAQTSDLRKRITNPAAWDDALSAEPETLAEPVMEEPPRGGAGATADAWRAYAATRRDPRINVPEDATRDEIIALVDAR